jgi:hypothetical protein
MHVTLPVWRLIDKVGQNHTQHMQTGTDSMHDSACVTPY